MKDNKEYIYKNKWESQYMPMNENIIFANFKLL